MVLAILKWGFWNLCWWRENTNKGKKSLTVKTFKIASKIPLLKQLGTATGVVGFVNHINDFLANPNWTDGIEAGGQLGIWIFKALNPESLIIDALELGYNNITMLYDSFKKK